MAQSTLSMSQNGRTEPFELQVARGQVPYHSAVNIFGYQSAVGTSFIPVWENATAYPAYPTSAAIQYLWSSSASDTTNTIQVMGLDGSYNPISETVTLNGTTHVATVNSYLRINNLFVTSATAPVGKVNIGPSSTTTTIQYAEITIGVGKSQMAIYTVPNGYTFYLTRVNLQSQLAGGASNYGEYRVQSISGTSVTQLVLQTPFTSAFSITRVIPFPYAAKTDLQFQCKANSSTLTVGIQIEGYLVQNDSTPI
jgi:hypothetical protein